MKNVFDYYLLDDARLMQNANQMLKLIVTTTRISTVSIY